jgi:hypothetical protein
MPYFESSYYDRYYAKAVATRGFRKQRTGKHRRAK